LHNANLPIVTPDPTPTLNVKLITPNEISLNSSVFLSNCIIPDTPPPAPNPIPALSSPSPPMKNETLVKI